MRYRSLLVSLIFLFSFGCATRSAINKEEWEGIVYTVCSESGEVLNEEIRLSRIKGFVDLGGQVFDFQSKA